MARSELLIPTPLDRLHTAARRAYIEAGVYFSPTTSCGSIVVRSFDQPQATEITQFNLGLGLLAEK